MGGLCDLTPASLTVPTAPASGYLCSHATGTRGRRRFAQALTLRLPHSDDKVPCRAFNLAGLEDSLYIAEAGERL